MNRIERAARRALITIMVLVLATALLPAGAKGQQAEPVRATKWGQAAVTFLNRIDTGDYAGAASMAAPSTAAFFTAEKLGPMWKQITGGARLSAVSADAMMVTNGLHVVDVNVRIGDKPAGIRIALDDSLKVNGMFMIPPVAPPYNIPSYVDTTRFEEVRLQLNAGTVRLPAVLTLPKGVQNAPVVVLVHGSGPNDMDESLGPNRPFRDIAWGLASRGVAVLRYDKRTRVAPNVARTITVEEEVIADALTALDSARANPRIDTKRAYLLGHSLGAMLAPEMAARDGRLAGVLMLAGTPRSLAAVIAEQYAYLKTLPTHAGADVQKILNDGQAAMQRLVRREAKAEEDVGGAPASYFYDLDARDALKHAKSLTIPMLFLQGARDYQVTPADLDLWRKGLAGSKNASYKLYPDLNHLFMTGPGAKATPAEYSVAGSVKEEVIADIAKFISSR